MSRRALIVDDSLAIRMLVSRALQTVGFDVLEAQNGEDALMKLEAYQATLIVTDYNMPVMDGLAFTRRVRALDRYRFTPIVFLTTESDVSRKELARLAGATAWLVKPFTAEKVIAVVNRVVPSA